MKVAFDFDFTLSEPHMQKLAKKFIQEGHEVFIITSRSNRKGGWMVNDNNSDLEKIAVDLGIDKIIYTSHELKLLFMPDDTDLFFDDDMIEVEEITKHMPQTVAICSRTIDKNLMSS